MILDAVRESGGTAVAVAEARIPEWLRLAVSSEGISFCPESAACVGAAEMLTQSGWLRPNERVVIYNCGAAQKYAHIPVPALPMVRKDLPVDWAMVAAGGEKQT